eukprot:CAMPEP_0173105786 /NCGR_PEP_ID=MMETSP1102-20130122/40414_1 /TAXON_ID=49646 /ORGANISM="Geminigera sp., Strain Caron Lab Isolate" /LENGTH=120 /DNA_ID=CAMNT_0014002301 /DNA_START=139 /DNA_END=501 /DNA_ORIENTATION=-
MYSATLLSLPIAALSSGVWCMRILRMRRRKSQIEVVLYSFPPSTCLCAWNFCLDATILEFNAPATAQSPDGANRSLHPSLSSTSHSGKFSGFRHGAVMAIFAMKFAHRSASNRPSGSVQK